jgi:hypothetical protein
MSAGFGSPMAGNVETSPEKFSPKNVAAKLFNLQGCAESLSSVPVWAEPSQLHIGDGFLRPGDSAHIPIIPASSTGRRDTI